MFKNKNKRKFAGILLTSLLMLGCYTQCESAEARNYVNNSSEVVQPLNVEMEQYIRKTRRLIKNNWYPPTASYENSATLELKISRDGKLLDCSLSEKSNDEGFNESLIQAAQKTKFIPLPNVIGGQSIDLSLSFGMARRHIEK